MTVEVRSLKSPAEQWIISTAIGFELAQRHKHVSYQARESQLLFRLSPMTNTWPSGRRCRSMNTFSWGSRYPANKERWKEEIIHHLRPIDYNEALKKSTTWSSQSTFDHLLVENENSLVTSVNPFVNRTLKPLDLAISTPQCCSRRQCSQIRDACTDHCFPCVRRMGCCVMLLQCNTIYNKLPLSNL